MLKANFKKWVAAAVEAAVILGLLFCFFWPYRVDGGSMLPGVANGDFVVESRFVVFAGSIKRGDIVVIHNPIEKGRILKRVVAVPGDSLIISGGAVYVNGDIINEPYVGGAATKGERDVVLGAGEYYVLGDNREVSIDSRSFGAVKKSDIIGKMYLRVFPFNKIRLFRG